MLKIVAILRRKEGISGEVFEEHWRERHPAYVMPLPGIRGYRQNVPIAHRKEWPFDGVAELWFDSVSDVAAAFASPEADEMRIDEARFLESIEWMLVDEIEVLPFSPSLDDEQPASRSDR
jgi:uncharacterized protein (TIGR02118 family)